MGRKEVRQDFEQKLRDMLATKFDNIPGCKPRKDKLSFVWDSRKKIKFKESYIAFTYAHTGYNILVNIEHPEFNNFAEKINPPYKLEIYTSFFYSSLSKTDGRFGIKERYGFIYLPQDIEDNPEIIEYIGERLEEDFIPKAINYIEMKPELIDDVLEYPEDYHYPIITIIKVLKENNLPLENSLKAKLLNDKYSGDIEFDKNLLDNFDNL